MDEARPPDIRRPRVPLIAILYFAMALASAFLSATITPPGVVPDESVHFYYASAIAHGQVLATQGSDGAGATLPRQIGEAIETFAPLRGHPEVKATPALFAAASSVNDTTPSRTIFSAVALYPPFAYLVSAGAVALADVAGLPVLRGFYVGRLANALFYALVTALAIALLPTARLPVAAMLLLPMATFEAGSYAADGVVIALSALLCALVARWSSIDRQPALPALVGLAILAAIIAATKLPLIALALPVAALAGRRSWRLALLLLVLIGAAVAAWVLLLAPVSTFMAWDIGVHRSASEQLIWALQHPQDALATFGRSFVERWRWYVEMTIGILGFLDTPMSPWYYGLAETAGIAAALAAVLAPIALPWRYRVTFLVSAIGGVALIFVTFFLLWSAVGGAYVDGVQGRYFLPLIPALALGLAGWIRTPPVVATVLGSAAVALWGVSFFHTAMVLLDRFYIGS